MNTHRAGIRRTSGKVQLIHSGSEASCHGAVERHAKKHGNDPERYEVIQHLDPLKKPKGWD
ncbi:hypothetical protein SEA_MACGULLY_78 [Rhodococcus phage MacGully]|nr:hypothetical protein SEA_MACGULLY_78 [Rhodococcus phage MacGully]